MTEEGTYMLAKIHARCIEEGDCLLWQGALASGSCPVAKVDGKVQAVRRWIWTATGRKFRDAGSAIVARCGDDRCLVEAHMVERLRGPRPGTRYGIKLKAKMSHIQRAKSKLTEQDVADIRASGEKLTDLATRYGMGKRSIQNIRAHRTWQDYSNPFAGLGARG